MTWYADAHLSGLEVCPRCYTPKGGSAPLPITAGGPRQLVHVYDAYKTRGDAMGAFQREAALLARLGWSVANQAAAGTVMANLRRQPATVSVTYTRDA